MDSFLTPLMIVGGGEDRMETSGVVASTRRGICDDGGGVIDEDWRSATIGSGDVRRLISSFGDARSTSCGCGVVGISVGDESPSKEVWEAIVSGRLGLR